MSEEETKSVVIKDFFKRSVILNELDEALKIQARYANWNRSNFF